MGNLAPIKQAFTEKEYRQQREAIRAAYGETKKQAGNRYEQELAKLFYVSNWTQEKLAEIEGRSISWISERVIFGRFLTFTENSATGGKTEKALFLLSERKFRGYFRETDKKLNERQRFKAVLDLLELETDIKSGKSEVGEQAQDIVNKFADGKWHHLESIESFIGADPMPALKQIKRSTRSYHTVVERRKYGTSFDYRLVKGSGKKVDIDVLKKEVRPLIDELKKEGKCSMATMSPSHVALLTDKLWKLINKLG